MALPLRLLYSKYPHCPLGFFFFFENVPGEQQLEKGKRKFNVDKGVQLILK